MPLTLHLPTLRRRASERTAAGWPQPPRPLLRDRDLAVGSALTMSTPAGESQRVAPASEPPRRDQLDLRACTRAVGVAGGVDPAIA
jgi:hypothetical protein